MFIFRVLTEKQRVAVRVTVKSLSIEGVTSLSKRKNEIVVLVGKKVRAYVNSLGTIQYIP